MPDRLAQRAAQPVPVDGAVQLLLADDVTDLAGRAVRRYRQKLQVLTFDTTPLAKQSRERSGAAQPMALVGAYCGSRR